MQPLFARRAAAVAGAILVSGGAFAVSQAHAAKAGHKRADDMEILKKAQTKLMEQKSYRSTTKLTTADGKTTERTVECIPPKSYHIISEQMEMIILPEGSYQKARGKWIRFPMDMSKMISSMTPSVVSEAAEHITVKPLGPAVWQGSPANTYAVAYSDKGTSSNGKAWIRISDGLPVHMEANIDSPKRSFGGKSFGGKMKSVTDYDYKTPVTITAPM